MRFVVLVLIALLMSPAASFAQAERPQMDDQYKGVLRGFIWGLPTTVILENETGTFMGEEGGALFYMDYIRGMKCTIAYDFEDNKLWRARIFIEKEYANPQDRIDDLLAVNKDLNKRFGKPVSEDFRWLNDRDKNWPKSWGWAVYKRELFIRSKWQDEETEVTTYLGAPKKYKPEMNITYENRAVRAKRDATQDQNLLQIP